MKIAYSDITMQSNRYYSQGGVKDAAGTTGSVRTNFSNGLTQVEEGRKDVQDTQISKNDFQLTRTSSGSETSGNLGDELTSIRNNLLQGLWQLLFGGSSNTGSMRSMTNFGSLNGLNSFGSFSLMGSTMTQNLVSYSEEEFTNFNAKGLATTEDGRQLDFNIAVSMSRSFMQYTQVQVPNPYALMDPLMINVGSSVANISDQKFTFDLDADGTEEEISMPGAGTGFLAFDKNGDGIINDGNELFGARSGDGFAELRAYDDDGNGWIDENDAIFSKLKVWYKNGDGEDELVDLLSADVGAIYLGSEQTNFSLYSQGGLGDVMNAMIRATGFFLKESGGVGTIQHVDLAATVPGADDSQEDTRRVGSTLNAAGEDSDTLVVKSSDNGLKIDRTDRRRSDKAEETARNERRERKAEQTKALREKQIARRKEERERLDELFAERAENRRQLKEELYEDQRERHLEEEELTEQTIPDAAEDAA